MGWHCCAPVVLGPPRRASLTRPIVTGRTDETSEALADYR